MSDSEWRDIILTSFSESGLIPDVISAAPPGLVNINFGTHNCVHMGTQIETEISAYEPSAVSWPAEEHKRYALVMLDVDNGFLVHWMMVNIPGTDWDGDEADTVAEYNSPTPMAGDGPHRYFFLVFEQTEDGGATLDTASAAVARYVSRACEYGGRTGFHLPTFRRDLGLDGADQVVAANYFTVEYDHFVDSIVGFCAGRTH